MVKTEHFLALHHGSGPLLLPNAWDRGSAALLTALCFSAIATTVGGAFAFAAFGALADAAKEFRERGSYGFLAGARTGRDAVRDAFPAWDRAAWHRAAWHRAGRDCAGRDCAGWDWPALRPAA